MKQQAHRSSRSFASFGPSGTSAFQACARGHGTPTVEEYVYILIPANESDRSKSRSAPWCCLVSEGTVPGALRPLCRARGGDQDLPVDLAVVDHRERAEHADSGHLEPRASAVLQGVSGRVVAAHRLRYDDANSQS